MMAGRDRCGMEFSRSPFGRIAVSTLCAVCPLSVLFRRGCFRLIASSSTKGFRGSIPSFRRSRARTRLSRSTPMRP